MRVDNPAARMRGLVGVVIALCALCSVCGGCRGGGQGEGAQIKIGYLPITVNVPFFVAMEKGYFRSEGLRVEPVRFESTTELFNAMIAGRVPVTAVGGITALYALEGEHPGEFKIYWFNANAGDKFVDNFIVRKDSPITSFRDLKGRKLGVFPGTTSEMAARLVLRKFGLTAGKDVEVIPIPPQNHLQALETGRVDGLISMEPTGTLAIVKGVGRIVEEAPQEKHVMEPLPGGAAAFQSSWLREHGRTAAKVKRAIDRAIDFTTTNPAEAKRTLPKYSPITEDVAAQTRLCLYWSTENADRESIQAFADLLLREGVLRSAVDTRKLYVTPSDLE